MDRILLGALVALSMLSGAAQAALIDRGGGFIYDDVLDITWTQNANINGQDTWANQVAWASGLSITDTRPGASGVDYDDWRLADMDLNGDGTIVDCSSATELACRDNEYGYMNFQNGVSSSSPGIFTNVIPANYWSGREYDPTNAHRFYFPNGLNLIKDKGFSFNAWAVRSGDVAAVPVPAAVWLFSSAIGLLGWMRRKQSV